MQAAAASAAPRPGQRVSPAAAASPRASVSGGGAVVGGDITTKVTRTRAHARPQLEAAQSV